MIEHSRSQWYGYHCLVGRDASMDHSSWQKRKWHLTPKAFDQLLAQLHIDREQAAQEYERVRRRLLEFFDEWGCLSPEDCADETMNRIARIIDEGMEVRDLNSCYFLGEARPVLWNTGLRMKN
jgi:hypothetical protein